MIDHTELMKSLSYVGFGYLLGLFILSIGRIK